jgi:hypothetical protein
MEKVKYCCENCNFITNKKTNYDIHLLTKKHITNKEQNKTKEKVEEEKIFCCEICNKKYKSNVGLWKHKKTCIVEPTPTQPQTPVIKEHTPTITKETVKDFIEKNPDLFVDFFNSNNIVNNEPIVNNEQINVIVENFYNNDNNFNIVELIENNPISNLTNTYQNKLINKIKENFTNNEQHLFVSSFYCYLNCNKTDFIIDLDNIWEWLGFINKGNSKRLLEKHFKPEIDYKISLYRSVKRDFVSENDDKIPLIQTDKRVYGGQNKETFLLTIETFKLFCIKAGTEKASIIHKYYVKMERILHETIKEECNEFKLLLQNKETLIEEHKKQLEEQKKQLEFKDKQTIIEKELLREKTLLEQFPLNTECIYIGIIDNTNETNERLVKFGRSNDLQTRIKTHKTAFTNFRLIYAYRVENNINIENCIKNDKMLIQYRRSLEINSVNQTELLSYEKITLQKIDEIIKKIIITNEYTAEKITKLLEENERLKTEVNVLKTH